MNNIGVVSAWHPVYGTITILVFVKGISTIEIEHKLKIYCYEQFPANEYSKQNWNWAGFDDVDTI